MSESLPFQQVGNTAGFDYATAGTQPAEKGVAQAQRNTLRVWTPSVWNAFEKQNFGMWETEYHDASTQGLNHPAGKFSLNANGMMASSLITDEPNSMHLAPTPIVTATPKFTGDVLGCHSAFVFGKLVVGGGSGANVSLWVTTSTTDSTPSAVTYSPTAAITSLTRIVVNGAEKLLVGRVGAAAQIHSAVGTVETTMDAGTTSSLWGCIMAGQNAAAPGVPVLLIYAGTAISTKATNATMTTATVATSPATVVPAGGYAIGAITPRGRAQRAYWFLPRATTTAGALKYGAEVLGDVWSTNMEGTDLQPYISQYFPDGLRGAIPYRDGFVIWDDEHVGYWDSEKEWDLQIFEKRIGVAAETWNFHVLNSDVRRRVRSALVIGPDLYVQTNTYTLAATAQPFYNMEKYRYESGTWHSYAPTFASVQTANAEGVNAQGLLCGNGGIPYDLNTKRAFIYETHTSTPGAGDNRGWFAYFIPHHGESLLWEHSLGTGSQTTNIPQFYNDGRWLSPNWRLDGIVRNPKVCTQIEFGGDLDFGGTTAYTVTITVRGRMLHPAPSFTDPQIVAVVTFSQGQNVSEYIYDNVAWTNFWDLQIHITTDAVAGTDLRTNIELLPFRIRGIYSKSEQPITETHRPSAESLALA